MIIHDGKVCFEIREEIAQTEYSRRFVLDTEYGPKAEWCSRKFGIYKYKKDSKIIWEIWIPEHIAEKKGLI